MMRRSALRLLCGVLVLGLLWGGVRTTRAASTGWLVYSVFPDPKSPDSGGLWMVRPDGSGKKRVVKGKGILAAAASPDGSLVAYYAYDPDPVQGEKNVTLDMLSVADGTTRTVTRLDSPATEMKEPGDNGPTAAFELAPPPLAWSPDGQTLAFIGAQGASNSADLYIYQRQSGKVKAMSSGPSQAIQPSWSPDAKYILHLGVEGFGSGAGSKFAGVWVARADGSGVTTLYKPTGGDEGSYGWLDNTTFLAWSWEIDCGKHNIRAFNVETKKATTWVKESYNSAAFAPVDGVLMVDADQSGSDCANSLAPGLYRLAKNSLTPAKVSDTAPYFLTWSPEAGTFFGIETTGMHLVQISLDGEISEPFQGIKSIPVVSSDNTLWAWLADPDNTLYVAKAQPSDTDKSIKIEKSVGVVVWVR